MKIFRMFIVLLAFLVLTPIFVSAESSVRKIVVFKEGITHTQKDLIKEKYNLSIVKNLKGVNAQSVYLAKGKVKELQNDSSVKYVEEDTLVSIVGKPNPDNDTSSTQTLPWGVEAIDSNDVWSNYTGTGVKVAVLDTGIDMDHPDLVDNVKGGINFVNTRKSFNDDNGHGTHVAGTIAAVNNTIGVVGVGPNIELYGVKVLNRRGSGYTSDIIAGLEWAVDNNIDVVNMSIGSDYYNQAYEDAINYAYANGVILVAAAGNDGSAVDYPAAYDNVIAVSAMAQDQTLAYFSSRGPEVDVTAPGVSILSTYKDGLYATMDGTSMATPHVAGIVALMIQSGTSKDLVEIRARFASDCIDLGDSGKDEFFGYGLVNAYNLVP